MLTVSQVGKAHAGRVLFENASLQVNRGDRVGLIGPNGAGKTTLFSLILGEQSPDAGSISLQRGVTLGFLPQESAPSGDESILELATNISPAMEEARRAMRAHPDENSAAHHDAHARFAELDGFTLEARAKRILAGLAFRESDFHRPARTMSGGWIMRAHLARLLVMEPDLLMLDEPTNHLDLESLGWFQNHLMNYDGAILTISHDREFLNAVCQTIVEISRRQLVRYAGNFDFYLEQKRAREEQHLAAYKNQQREIETLQRFADRFRAKASKASQAQDKLKQIARMERIDAPERAEATVRFRFPQPERSGQRVVVLRDVCQGYGDLVVYRDLNLTIERDQRTVLVGPNGAGKSTLLKILAGVVPLRSGAREVGHNAEIGYFSQHRAETLVSSRTVLAEAVDGARPVPEQTVRTVLGSFLFRGDDVFKTVGVLSGGEKSRLALVKLLLSPPNFLLLDEPTTHLDMASIDALIGALQQYAGTILFVSHDVHFIRAIATSVLHVHSGQLTPYPGGYDYYLEKSRASSAKEALVATLSNHQPGAPAEAVAAPRAGLGMKEIREQRRAESEKRQAAARERRAREARVRELELEILKFEEQQKTLAAQLEEPEAYADAGKALEINRQLAGVAASLKRANGEWESAVEALGAEAAAAVG
jgi:ATP-binding cassette, subfamily F, member 3